MRFHQSRFRTFVLTAVCTAASITAFPGGASAGETVLYSFLNSGDLGQADGVVRDSSGNIYGTAETGGTNGGGGIFELIPSGGTYTENILYSFCALSGCVDGQTPLDRVIMDTNGDLYGVTYAGGKYNGGAVFELIPNSKRTSWKLVTLYSFCKKTNCADGYRPTFALTYQGAQSGALYDGTSPLFGNTIQGGFGSGVIYELTYVSGKKTRAEKAIHKFCKKSGCRDGQYPNGTPVMDSSGRIYSTASAGGTHGGDGVIYRLAFSTYKNRWGEKVLYDFGSQSADGISPVGALVRDSSGNLFGLTYGGGAHGTGTVFQYSSGTETLLYSFCSQTNCADGSNPNAGMTMDANGNLFGETSIGGTNGNGGVLFELSKGAFTELYSFGTAGDLFEPAGGVVLDSSGNIYGAAFAGGTYNKGGVYEYSSGAR